MSRASNSFVMRKHGNTLIAEDDLALEMLARVKSGQKVTVNMTVARNTRQHNLFFALINVVYKAQPEPRMYPTAESLRKAILMSVGHFYMITDLHGRQHPQVASMDFASLDQIQFQELFDAAIAVVLERVIPNVKKDGLEQEIYNMLGEPGPDALRR